MAYALSAYTHILHSYNTGLHNAKMCEPTYRVQHDFGGVLAMCSQESELRHDFYRTEEMEAHAK